MRKRSRRRRSKPPVRVKILIGLLLVLAVSGIAAVKFLQTPRGTVFLLSRGFSGYYSGAQEHVGKSIFDAMERLGLKERVRVKRFPVEVGGKNLSGVELRVACDEKTDLIGVNLSVTKAVRATGARILKSVQLDDGATLYMEIGAGKFVTHRIVAQKSIAGSGAVAREKRPRLALVIDDFGYNLDEVVRSFFELDLPLTFSIIPSLPHSRDVLEEAPRYGKQVMLHLPMEPEGEHRSDVAEVTTSMTDGEIRTLVEEYLDGMEGIVGVNNHMGSKATGDERVMKAVLEVVKNHGLFFLDSLTSPRSVAYNSAKSMGVKAARNDLFLDDDTEDPVLIEGRLRRLLEKARSGGEAVGIAHPHRWTLDVLAKNKDHIENSGVELVFLSELVR